MAKIKQYNYPVWSDEVEPGKATYYIAYGPGTPTVGRSWKCFRMGYVDGKRHWSCCYTSDVKEVLYIGNDTYYVRTLNSVYIAMVKKVEDCFNVKYRGATLRYGATFIGYAHSIPTVGESCECFIVQKVNRRFRWDFCSTSDVKEVLYIGNNTYHVKTPESDYILWLDNLA